MPFKVLPPEGLDVIGEAALDYLKSCFRYSPLLILGGLPPMHICTYVNMMDGLRQYHDSYIHKINPTLDEVYHNRWCSPVINGVEYGVQDIRPTMDRLACKGKIYQWWRIMPEVDVSREQYMYRPTAAEMEQYNRVLDKIGAAMGGRV